MRHDAKGRDIFDQKASAGDFARALEGHCNWFSAVPDSVFRKVLPELREWHLATRENHAVGMAFGAKLGGLRPALLIQNSGLGLSIDALLGTFSLYGQGLLLVVSNRGVLSWEEIQHQDWGKVTKPLLSALGIPMISFDEDGLEGLTRAALLAKENKVVALIVERGNIDE
jgi:sulfopyruvate decarboxylase TPP-binding subunit